MIGIKFISVLKKYNDTGGYLEMNETLNFEHPFSHEDFRREGYKMVDYIINYYKTLDSNNIPVQSQVQPGYLRKLLPESPPEFPESFQSIMDDINEKISPGITHWQSPNFFSYFPANSSYPGILGDMCSSMFNVIGFSWICSPACTELETIVLDWLAKAMSLPKVRKFWSLKK